MNNLYINLLNFKDDKLAGTGYFFKRIISEIDFDHNDWQRVDKVVVFCNSKINLIKVFGIKESHKLVFIIIPLSSSFLVRILLEQFFLPFYLIKSKGVFLSPTPAVPLFSRFINKNLVIIPTIHDMIPFHVKEKYSFFRSVYIKAISITAARVADKVITVSVFSKNDIVKIAKINADKIVVIYNSIPELVFNDQNIVDNYFLTICTIEPGKNLENMIKGFDLFIKKNISNQKYKYKIIGQMGWNYKAIVDLVNELDLQEKVDFCGYISDQRKNEYIKNCIGLIYLSKYEGFGIPPLEAMYFNKVSIVSDTSSLPEVVGNAGIVQNYNDIQLLADNLELLLHDIDRYKKNIVTQLRKFDSKSQIEKFNELILSNYR